MEPWELAAGGANRLAEGDTILRAANALRPRLGVTFNTTRSNTLTAGKGRDWFLYANPKDSVNAKSSDSVSRS